MLLPHHVFTILLTENSKVPIEISVSTLVFTKVLTVFVVKKVCGVRPIDNNTKRPCPMPSFHEQRTDKVIFYKKGTETVSSIHHRIMQDLTE